jgi:FtsP/CotA-like multicopper oxidase with cupredoxin domain
MKKWKILISIGMMFLLLCSVTVTSIFAGTRSYSIVSLQTRIVINKFGDHDPNGQMYVLAENEQALRQQVAVNPFTPVDLVEPLVIRANVGDTINITFTNKLNVPAGINCQGVEYLPNTSDGAYYGKNNNTLAAPGQTVQYTWKAVQEGIFSFNDMGNAQAFEEGSNTHGLFGALVVEKAGATWTDPNTGGTLNSGKFADIHHPNFPDYREFVILFQDEPELLDRDGMHPTEPNGRMSHTFMVNYRSEPSRNRLKNRCPNCVGEESVLSSWPYGDPATPICRSYLGDPSVFKIMHMGVKETHGFHLHAHQWRMEPNDPNSSIIDAISFGPQQSFILDILHGAGSLKGTIGDSIWHCHLYPHFDMGMWGLWRVHDRLENGTRKYPDGTPIKKLVPLPDRAAPPAPTAENPGYPFFIPGTFGQRAPKPPMGIEGGREATALEQSALPNIGPGTAFINPIPPGAPIKFFDIVAIQLPITYNRAGWFDPQGRILCLAEDEAAIRAGIKAPEPLAIRVNAGDGVHIRFTNKLPTTLGGNEFQELIDTIEAGCHVHLVKFDVLVSDGASNGWNYDSGADTGQTIHYVWYADRELRACFFHDHFFPNSHQQHGYFATCVVEPAGSTYHDPKTGAEIKSGTKAVIKNPNIKDFREFVVFHHDFIITYDKNGNPVNPPPFPSAPNDFGTMAVNYRNEPFQFRNDKDPAYVFSSYVHGDPFTPLLEAYNEDPIFIRLLHGAHEEQHTFNVNGLHWKFDPEDPHSGHVQGQTITLSEQFDIRLNTGDPSKELRDYLYWSGGLDDLWLGMWGLIRIHGKKVSDLVPLEDNPASPTEPEGPLPSPGVLPPKAGDPGIPAPDGTPVRKFNVVAFMKDVVYNKFGDHDPNGMILALAEDEAAIRAGAKPVEPLVIRANEEELIEITLTNKLPVKMPAIETPPLPVPAFWPVGNRVGLSPQLVHYWIRGSDGTAVGFNPDQTVGPGQSITYRWFVPHVHSIGNMWSFGDVIHQRHHGLWGAIAPEFAGARYLDPYTMKEIKSGLRAVIAYPDVSRNRREFVVFLQDGLNLLDKNNVAIPNDPRLDDPEDQGEKGFNYRSEPFRNRLQVNSDVSKVFSSTIHGDPATTLFEAYPGDNTIFRTLMPSDRPRNHSFTILGHIWPLDVHSIDTTNIVGNQGSISIGSAFDMLLLNGAGGSNRFPGDYAYRSGVIRPDIEAGMWGIFRVHGDKQANLPLLSEVTPSGFSVRYKCGDPAPTDNHIKPHFMIVNNTGAPVPLSQLKIRYWYTIDTEKPQAFWVDYAKIGNNNVTGRFVKMATPKPGANYYLEVGFTAGAGSIDAASDTGEIQTRFNKTDWSNYNEAGDYSYDPTKTSYTTWDKITLYYNNVLVYGTEP